MGNIWVKIFLIVFCNMAWKSYMPECLDVYPKVVLFLWKIQTKS